MNITQRTNIAILYVEDDAATRDEVVQFLRRHTDDVIVACDGREALEAYARKKPDIVVTDIRMPVMDGLQMAQEIKSRDHDAKIIMTSAYLDTEYLLKAIELGVDGYVMKPVDTDKLLAAINRCALVIGYQRAAQRSEEARNQSMEELKETLARLNTLHGVLPICSSCKKIRDDRGSWHQLEQYISQHSDATFSHGLCNSCASRLYPDFFPGAQGDPIKKKDPT